jgi:Holliday junction resolvase|tara:strand:- start:906 stop:1307 length:402 start_codon:yes stop_codon:yes gene_type:complete
MKKEKDTYQSLKRNLPKVHWQRIESGATSRGVPDINACYAGKEFWVELKILHGDRVSLTPQQVAWHTRRSKQGGITWIMVHDSKTNTINLISGSQSVTLAKHGLSSCMVIQHTRPIDWEALLLNLCLTDKLID